jgi:hypothetical protein
MSYTYLNLYDDMCLKLVNSKFWNNENIKEMIKFIQIINMDKDSDNKEICLNEIYNNFKEHYNYNICNDYFLNKTAIKLENSFNLEEVNYYEFINKILIF